MNPHTVVHESKHTHFHPHIYALARHVSVCMYTDACNYEQFTRKQNIPLTVCMLYSSALHKRNDQGQSGGGCGGSEVLKP